MKIHGEGELISAYLDGELCGEEAEAVQSHIASCPSCREEHASLRAAKSLLARAPRRAMPPELVAQIEGRLARPLWRQVLDRLLPPMPVLVPAGACAAAALLAVVWFGARRAAPDQSIPLEPLLAAHSRYTAEALVPPTELVAANYSAQLNAYYGDSPDQE
ncbi:MAG: anti-sigma factor [Elusimicrobia bacterium]|nr:anti-sigma factor [Elusimicrobiota bacterium]